MELKTTILVAGIDGVMDKLCYIASALREKGIDTVFYSDDRIGYSHDISEKWGFRFVRAPRNFVADCYVFASLLREVNPRHVELYLGSKPWVLAAYLALIISRGKLVITWCRGEIREWDRYNYIRRLVQRHALRRSAAIIIKELYMERMIRERQLADAEQLVFLHNRVPVYHPPINISQRNEVLFLNSFNPMRRVELVIEAANLVRMAYPRVRFKIVGATKAFKSYSPAPESYENTLSALVHKLGLHGIVSIEPFTDVGVTYYERAATFVLPADVIFCNNSLLEAMERGVVPIVSDVDGADRMVEDGVSGFLVEQDATSIAAKILYLLENPSVREQMGWAAREKVISKYDVRATADYLVNEVYPRLY